MIQEKTPQTPPAAATLPGPRGGLKLGPAADRPAAFIEAIRTHGEVICLDEERGVYMISHPDHVKHVLQDNHTNYRHNIRKKVLMGKQSLALSAGDAWRQRRRLLQPIFNQQRLAPLAPKIVAGTQRMVERWQGPAGRGEAVDVAEEMSTLTLDLLIESLLGGDERGRLRRSVHTAFEYFNDRLRRQITSSLWVPTPRNLRFVGALRGLSSAVRRTLAQHQEGAAGDDLLTMMLSARDEQSGQTLNPDQLQDELMMLLVMGHMTTAMAMTWTFHLLARHPEAEARVRAEIAEVIGDRPATFQDVARLTYTRQVIEETLRLYPPSWSFSRVALGDDEIGGYRIPAGSVVTLMPWATHRRPELWPDADRFDPERFAPSKGERPRFAYYPFGGGPRVCIARDMALMELPLILATVLQRYRLRPLPGSSTTPVPGIVLRPQAGLKMTLEDPKAPKAAARKERPFETLPGLVLLPAPGEAPAFLRKADGRWQPSSRTDFLDRVRRLAKGLVTLGVTPGDRLALQMEDGPDWLAIDLAALAAGAVVVPLQASLDAEATVRFLRDGQVRWFLTGPDRLRDILARRAELPEAKGFVQIGGGGAPAGEGVLTFGALLDRGAGANAQETEALVRQRRAADPATLIFTPGTEGEPKAVVLTHGNLAAEVAGLAESLPFRAGDTAFSFLPLARPLERVMAYVYLFKGLTVAHATSVETVQQEILEVRPHVLASVPEAWKHLLNWLFRLVQSNSPTRQKVFQFGVKVGRIALPFRVQHKRPGGVLGFYLGLSDRFIFPLIHKRLGGRLRFAVSGGDRLPHGWITFLWAAGVQVYEGYGLTEAAGAVTVNTPRATKPGTAGIPLPGVELRIADDGEILVRGETVAPSLVDTDGWLHTGDLGWIDDAGMLNVLGRKADVFQSPQGKRVSPAGLETLIKSSHFIGQAVVVGDGRPHNAALLAPDLAALQRMAQNRGVTYSTLEELVRNPKIRNVVENELKGYNDKLGAHDKIQAWDLLPNGFTVEGGELSPTRTLRRRFVREKYAAQIEKLYGGS